MRIELTTTTRLALEALYTLLLLIMECGGGDRVLLGPFYNTVVLSGIVQLATILEKPCPIQTRKERRRQRLDVIQ